MKTIKIIIIALISLFIGYNVYPILNSKTETIDKKEINSLISTTNTNCIESNKEPNQTQSKNLVSSKEQTINTSDTSPENTISGSNISMGENEQPIDNNPTYETPEQIELNDWTAVHKEDLMKLLSDRLPANFVEDLTKAILKDNTFLNSPTIQQDPAIVSDWAQMMEYHLRDVMERHPLIAGFQIYSLTCKQLTCEILGAENEPFSWMPIMNSFFKDPIINKNLNAPSIKGHSYPRDKINYWYIRLGFKS